MTPRLRRLVLLSGWVLVQRPTEWTNPTDPPIEKWKQVKRFDSEDDCQAYRNEALIAGAEMQSQAMLAQADSFRCVPSSAITRGASPSTTTTSP